MHPHHSNEDERSSFTLFLAIICYELPEEHKLSLKPKSPHYNLKAMLSKERTFSKITWQSLTSNKPLRIHRAGYSSIIT